MENALPIRKPNRLKNFNYNAEYAYFITICTQDRKCLLSRIVGTGVLTCPSVELEEMGVIAQQAIQKLDSHYDFITVDNYVIMPNHIHILLRITKPRKDDKNGQVRTPVPTHRNSTLSLFVATFKRFCTSAYGYSIWQPRFYDHIIRDEQDYKNHLRYIDENPLRWELDELYTK